MRYRTIERFPGYRFGDDGSVWSQYQCGKTDRRILDRWKQLKPARDKDGYLIISLRVDSGKKSMQRLARLILEAFNGSCPEGQEACHFDGVITNNCLSNLRWGTSAENKQDKRRHGTYEQRKQRRLTWEEAVYIRELAGNGESYASISREFGVSRGVIWQIVTGRTYSCA